MIIDTSNESRLLIKNLILTNNHIIYEIYNEFEIIERYFLIKPKIIFLDFKMNNYDRLTILIFLRQQDLQVK